MVFPACFDPCLVLGIRELVEVVAEVLKSQVDPIDEKLILLDHLVELLLDRFGKPLDLNLVESFENARQEVVLLENDFAVFQIDDGADLITVGSGGDVLLHVVFDSLLGCKHIRVLPDLLRVRLSVNEFESVGCARIIRVDILFVFVHFVFFDLVQELMHTGPRFVLEGGFIRGGIQVLFQILIHDLLNGVFEHLSGRQWSLESFLFARLTTHGTCADDLVEPVALFGVVPKILASAFDETIPFASFLFHSLRIIQDLHFTIIFFAFKYLPHFGELSDTLAKQEGLRVSTLFIILFELGPLTLKFGIQLFQIVGA